jgi:serine/threonine protein kinase
MQHPNILPVYDFCQEDDYTFLVMPYVQAGTLASKLVAGPLPLPEILHITTQIGDALTYAHDRGILHRDVKPSNILIDELGNCLLRISVWRRSSNARSNSPRPVLSSVRRPTCHRNKLEGIRWTSVATCIPWELSSSR